MDRTEEFLYLLGKHSRTLYLCVFSMVLNNNDTDDIIQEANLVLWREFHRFEKGSNFPAWAKQIAVNQVRAWKLRQKRDRHVFSDEILEIIAKGTNETDDLSARSLALSHCLDRLPSNSRRIVSMRYEQENDISEIAQGTKQTTAAVYQILSRIRKSLHDCVTLRLAQEASQPIK